MKKTKNRLRQKGAMMIEAAVIMPLFLTLMIGAVESARFITIHQKMTRAVVTMSDIVSRSSNLTNNQLNDIFFATETILSPYATGVNSRVIISSVTRSPGQPARIVWQRQGGGSMIAASRLGGQGGNAALPAGFTLGDNESVIVAEIFYAYAPMFISSDFVPQNMYDRAFFRPRLADNILVN
jgi:hypothetical protein